MYTKPTDGATILERYCPGKVIEYIDATVSGDEVIERFLRHHKPVIIRGLIDHWPALQRWNFSWFEREFGNIYTNVFGDGREDGAQHRRMHHLFAAARRGESLYSSLYVAGLLPKLRGDYPLDDLYLGDAKFNWLLDLPGEIHGQMNVLFIGSRGPGVANHRDSMGTHLWSAQIHGRKRWIIAPPEQAPFMHDGQTSWLTRQESIAAYPDFARAAAIDLVLHPGEVLILPVGWWHQTELLDDSISITHDIVNQTNAHAYFRELENSRGEDAKIHDFHRVSHDRESSWLERVPAPATREVERISWPIDCEELMQRYFIPHRPVVIQNAAASWPALQTWTLEYLGERYGNAYVQHFTGPDDTAQLIRLNKHLARAYPEPHYVMWCLSDFYDALAGDFGLLPFLGDPTMDWTLDLPHKEQTQLTWIFLGVRGSGIPCHSDRLGQHVVSVQISGRKRWLLQAPDDAPWLYDGDVDLRDPDLGKHPRYLNASPRHDFVLEPGETLFLPNGWWHQTEVLEDSISLSHDFMNRSNADAFLERLAVLRGPRFMESEAMKPLLAAWSGRRSHRSDHRSSP